MKLIPVAVLLVRALLQAPDGQVSFDWISFFSGTVGGMPLSLLVLLLVEWAKHAFELKGRSPSFVSMGIGLLFGIPYQFLIVKVGYAPEGIFIALCYGVGLGLLASGLYKLVEITALRQVTKIL